MKIDNKLSFAAAVLAFLGTVIIVMDRFGPVHSCVDRFPKWRNIALAVVDLDTFDTKNGGGKEVGMVEQGKPGFCELVHIILANRPDLQDKTIVAIAKNQPIGIGGVPMKIVHVALLNDPQGYSLTTDYIFHEWIRDYRDKYFLKAELSVIALGFLLNVFAHIKRKARHNT
jgi:hypothetical protein